LCFVVDVVAGPVGCTGVPPPLPEEDDETATELPADVLELPFAELPLDEAPELCDVAEVAVE
jgi:hypothetical protein